MSCPISKNLAEPTTLKELEEHLSNRKFECSDKLNLYENYLMAIDYMEYMTLTLFFWFKLDYFYTFFLIMGFLNAVRRYCSEKYTKCKLLVFMLVEFHRQVETEEDDNDTHEYYLEYYRLEKLCHKHDFLNKFSP
jgi:hypothetical protein